MVSVHIGAERRSGAKFAEPIQFPVETEILNNRKKTDDEAENQKHPDKVPRLVRGPNGLHGKKKQYEDGRQLHPFHLCQVGIDREPQKPLQQDEAAESQHRHQKRAPGDFHLPPAKAHRAP